MSVPFFINMGDGVCLLKGRFSGVTRCRFSAVLKKAKTSSMGLSMMASCFRYRIWLNLTIGLKEKTLLALPTYTPKSPKGDFPFRASVKEVFLFLKLTFSESPFQVFSVFYKYLSSARYSFTYSPTPCSSE